MKKKEFDSQICTTRKQSQRLLSIGLKPETADMTHHREFNWELLAKPPVLRGGFWTEERIKGLARPGMSGEEVFDKIWGDDIPAWTYGRLLNIASRSVAQFKEGSRLFATHDKEYNRLRFIDSELNVIAETENQSMYEAIVSIIELLVKDNVISKKYIQ